MKHKNNDSDYNIHSNFRLEKNAGYYEISFHLIIVQASLWRFIARVKNIFRPLMWIADVTSGFQSRIECEAQLTQVMV